MRMRIIERELIAGKSYFKSFNPALGGIITGRMGLFFKYGMRTIGIGKMIDARRKGKKVSTFAGEYAATKITGKVSKPVKTMVKKGHITVANLDRDPTRKNGLGGHSWITKPGQYDLVVVFHDANRVGMHIDVHVGRLSFIYRVKPNLAEQLRFNKDGMLTENSKRLILDHVRSEIQKGARTPQNLDHSRSNARSSWTGGDPDAKHYGAGRSRQIVLESKVDVFKTGDGHPIEMYSPDLNPHRAIYIYKIYDGTTTGTPILIVGAMTSGPPKLEDRLHLKMVHPEEFDNHIHKMDMSTSTLKYDGSSTHFVITKDGTRIFSPRTSVRTGSQIEYTMKINGIADTRSSDGQTYVGMAEILFREKTPWWDLRKNNNPYLPSATGSGILNSHALLPDNIEAELRIYRVDRIGRELTKSLSFEENRFLQERVANFNPEYLKVVEYGSLDDARIKGYEGVVIVPPGMSVNDGYKIKLWENSEDWVINEVGFYIGDKGGMSGVVNATSLDTDKTFNLGPGAFGGHDITKPMMENPDDYVGTVIKVQSKTGHSGRATNVIGFHSDKGFAPI